jgi:hypothetical protein
MIYHDLSSQLRNLSAAEIIQRFSNILPSVTLLDLSWNALGNRTAAEFAQILRAIPRSVTSLNLRGNKLGYRTAAELVQILRAIPPSVTSLNLRENVLGSRTGEELVQILGAIPTTVTSLNLSNNKLGNKTAAELVQILRAIPKTVTSLNLSNNKLGNKTAADLVKILRAIPAAVTSLNLSNNTLDRLSLVDIVMVLASVPDTVSAINLKCSRLEERISQNPRMWHGFLAEKFTSAVLNERALPGTARMLASRLVGIVPKPPADAETVENPDSKSVDSKEESADAESTRLNKDVTSTIAGFLGGKEAEAYIFSPPPSPLVVLEDSCKTDPSLNELYEYAQTQISSGAATSDEKPDEKSEQHSPMVSAAIKVWRSLPSFFAPKKEETLKDSLSLTNALIFITCLFLQKTGEVTSGEYSELAQRIKDSSSKKLQTLGELMLGVSNTHGMQRQVGTTSEGASHSATSARRITP